MSDSSNKLYWVIGGLLISILVLGAFFPPIREIAGNTMSYVVDKFDVLK